MHTTVEGSSPYCPPGTTIESPICAPKMCVFGSGNSAATDQPAAALLKSEYTVTLSRIETKTQHEQMKSKIGKLRTQCQVISSHLRLSNQAGDVMQRVALQTKGSGNAIGWQRRERCPLIQ